MAEGGQERTEKATPRKHEKVREQGSVPRSRELVAMVSTGGLLLVMFLAGGSMMEGLKEFVKELLSVAPDTDPAHAAKAAFPRAALIVAPLLVSAVAFSVAATLLQGGLVLKAPGFDLDKVNPVEGLKKLFSLAGVLGFVKNVVKFTLGCVVFYLIVRSALGVLPYLPVLPFHSMEALSRVLLAKYVFASFGAFFVVSLADYVLERWRFERSIRMTKREVKEELKEQEGDPVVRSRVKSLQKERARQRMMQAVPTATVVVTNPTHLAVALRYVRDEMAAPRVVAKGAGHVAETIVRIARRHGVPLYENRSLARALYDLEVGSLIPEELYRAVAKVLADIWRLRSEG